MKNRFVLMTLVLFLSSCVALNKSTNKSKKPLTYKQLFDRNEGFYGRTPINEAIRGYEQLLAYKKNNPDHLYMLGSLARNIAEIYIQETTDLNKLDDKKDSIQAFFIFDIFRKFYPWVLIGIKHLNKAVSKSTDEQTRGDVLSHAIRAREELENYKKEHKAFLKFCKRNFNTLSKFQIKVCKKSKRYKL